MSASAAFVALGANLQDPTAQILTAFKELGALPSTRLLRRSALYTSSPVGYDAQPDFINAVARIETGLAPHALLEELFAIERAHGRVRKFRNAPRTLDLDLLLFDGLEHQDGELMLPHPRLHERGFVLVPLAEIAPATIIPGHGAVIDLLRHVDLRGISRVAELGLGT